MLALIKDMAKNSEKIIPYALILALRQDFDNTIKFLNENKSIPIDWNQITPEEMKTIVNILKNSDYIKTVGKHDYLVINCPATYYLARKYYSSKDLSLEEYFGAIDLTKWSEALNEYYNKKEKKLVKFMELNEKEALKLIANKKIRDRQYFEKFSIDYKKYDTEELFNILVENKFVLDSKTSFLASSSYNPAFLLASLKNDRKKTIKLINSDNDLLRAPSFDLDYEEYKKFKEIITKHNINIDTIDEEISNYIYYYNIEQGQTIVFNEQIKDCVRYGDLKILLNCCKCLDNVQDKKLLNQYKEIIWQTLHLIPTNKAGVIESILRRTENILPMTLWDFKDKKHAEYHHSLDRITSDEFNTVINMLTKNDRYSPQEESSVIKRLNYDPTPQSVEEAIKYMASENKTRFQLSFDELYVMQIYAKKILARAGINTKVDMFGYSSISNHRGGFSKEIEKIYIYNGKEYSIRDMVRIINHEINHAIQHKNVREKKLMDDPEILDYAKDYCLRNILGEDYYNNNYRKISFEYDADYKAEIQTKLLFEGIEDLYKQKEQEYETLLEYNRSYKDDKTRTESNQSLDEFFVETINKMAIDQPLRYGEIVKNLKEEDNILCYEYEFNENGVKVRSLEELETLSKSSSTDIAKTYRELLEVKRQYNLSKSEEVSDDLWIKGAEDKISSNKVKYKKMKAFFKKEMEALEKIINKNTNEDIVVKEEINNGER